ncbi:MAG TPA: enoyl-CoA hydratase/isomerase family protein [Deltaproteobacteria bacterium]|nr:enoyl-CoA hydratase/isomerase family protein [Deltaproteobacteria bacterium]
MEYKAIIVEKLEDERIGIITLNRPEQMNTFDTCLAQELNHSLREFDKDKSIRVVVIKGAGRSFCAGIDITDFEGKSILEYREWIGMMDEMHQTIANMMKPVIASVHGYAVANGAGLVAACDLAVVSEDSKFGTTAINVGLFCMGPAVSLARHMGKKRALEMLLRGNIIDANTAERYGLVNKVVPKDKLEEETMKLARELASKSPVALQMGKKSFYSMWDMNFGDSLEYMGEVFARLCCTEDAQEGVKAFLEKRKPEWKER